MKNSSSSLQKTQSNITNSRSLAPFRGLPFLKLGLLVALIGFGVLTARASDPIGIYALVDKVVLEPSESAPERIQIWGVFAFAQGRGYEYDHAQRGYLYYKLNSAKKDVCLKEWSDLKNIAGTKQVVGFGNRYEEKGKTRAATEKPANPDVYPLGFGLLKMRDANYAPVKDLLNFADVNKDKKEPAKKDSKKTS